MLREFMKGVGFMAGIIGGTMLIGFVIVGTIYIGRTISEPLGWGIAAVLVLCLGGFLQVMDARANGRI